MGPQARVQAILDDLVERGVERGLQVAIYHRGELVVDAWSGLADAATGREVDGDTLFTIFSAGKAVGAAVIHLLAERGLLDYDTPVAEYWPEFAANGKAEITVKQVLAHTAGVPQMPDGIGVGEMCNWATMCNAIAHLSPLWEPGTQTGYHVWTYGWILGEVARRVDGRDFVKIVQEDISLPLGIDSLYFGIPNEVESRMAVLEMAALEGGTIPEPLPADSLWLRAFPEYLSPWAEVFNRSTVRRACIPAGNGTANARSLARLYSGCIGDLQGASLWSRERLAIATTEQTWEDDVVFGGTPGPRKALGFMLGGNPFSPMGSRCTVFGHFGAGGIWGFADPEYNLAFGLLKTRLVEAADGEGVAYLVAQEVRDALGIPS